MNLHRIWLTVALVALSACGSLRGELGLNDVSAVRTPIYSANKILFLEGTQDPRYAELSEGYELAARASSERDLGTRRSVRNRQPLSIVVSRAYVPATSRTCRPRASDAFFREGRDIAVLLDVSTEADRQEFIAVWYQQDVPPDTLLLFQDLLVYSTDSWDSKFPPYFRMRLVDVSSERNTAIGALLEQVKSASPAITGLLSIPGAEPIVGMASVVARRVLANERNQILADYTFQLYGEHLLAEAGGVPLGLLQTGGVVVTAVPCRETNEYWNGEFRFDYRLNRIQSTDGQTQAVPYVFATILTADLSVPQIVRTRSAAILERLNNPQIVQTELRSAQEDAGHLAVALRALEVRESFRRRPNKESFRAMLQFMGNMTGLDEVTRGFFLDTLYQITGRSLGDIAAYQAWADECVGPATFDPNAVRFVVSSDVVVGEGEKCWPDA